MQPINGIYVYHYHHDDDQQGWIPVEGFKYRGFEHSGPGVGDITEVELPTPTYIEKVRAALKEGGWEGDGTLGAMMVPPFFSSESDNYWFPLFHVKQQNNGTSWIASPLPLGVESLATP